MHALADYGLMHVKLYEDIARFGQVSISYDYPVMVNRRYLMSPSPIPAFDNPKMHMMPALQLFGAGREKRIYAIPPYTEVRSLDFDDHPFRAIRAPHACGLCGADNVYLDEVVIDDRGGRLFVCSDTDHCAERRAAGHVGAEGMQGGRRMTDDTLLSGARPVVVVRRHSRAGGGRCRSLARRDAGRGRRIRFRQDDAAERAVGPAGAGSRRGVVSRSGRPAARRACDAGARAAHAASFRLGLRASGPAAEPAHERHRRRQCRRAADGARRAALRRHPRRRRWNGCARWRSTPIASTICRAHSPAACCNGCRSRARW